jgi:hypothetical protein
MIHMITPHSLERTGIPLRITAMSLDLKERESTASLTLDDREGITSKQITGMWFYDDQDPGAGMVWRARSLSESLHTKTPVVQLEHIISTLKDTIIFDEVTPATITGNKDAKTVSAKAAINYILNRQETKDWKLYSFDPSYENVSQGYSFEGDTLYDALVTVCSTLEGCWWQFDTNHYPFRLYILNHATLPWVDTMLRAGRNLRTISVKTDKSGMYTRFWPVGKDDLHLTSSKSYKNDYILSSHASTYGVIDHTETDATIETASDLAAFARARLRKHNKPVVTIEVEGLELEKATMTPEDKIILGGLCEIVIGETGQKYEEKIIGKSYPDKMNTPELVRITLSNQQDDVAKIIAQEKKKTAKSSRVAARQSKQTKEILYNTVKEVRIDGPTGNNYKLQFKLVKDVDWKDAGTFSRAVTGWGVSAADGAVKVTAKPQNQSTSVKVRAGTGSWSGNVYNGALQYSADGGKNWSNITGASYSVNAKARYDAGWIAGWDNAEGMVVLPEAGTGTSFTLKFPDKFQTTGGVWNREQVTRAFFLSTDATPSANGYAYVKLTGVTISRISLTNWWTAGWDNAEGMVVMPSSGNSGNFSVLVPNKYQTTGGVWNREQVTRTFSLTTDSTPSANGYAYVKYLGDTVARRSLTSWWNSGWDNAEGLVDMPDSGTATSFTVKVPNKYQTTGGVWNREQVSKNFMLSIDESYAYVKLTGTTVARITQYYNRGGTLKLTSKTYSAGLWVFTYTQTVSSESSGIITTVNDSRAVRYHV